jgi:hypothetical protein
METNRLRGATGWGATYWPCTTGCGIGIFASYTGTANRRRHPKLAKLLGLPLCAEPKEFYSRANGLSAFSGALTVYGLRQSYQRSDLLAASAQPFHIGPPNKAERPAGLPPSNIVIGGYSIDGSNVVIDEFDRVFRCVHRDARRVLNTWSCFSDWLMTEIPRLGKLFDDAGNCLDKARILPDS